MKGKLYLIPSTLGGKVVEDVIPQGTLDIIAHLDTFVVEELRSGRRYLSAAGRRGEVSSLDLYLLNEHTDNEGVKEIIDLLLGGKSIGLISEAGLPAVADPGANLVAAAQQLGVEVVPLSGPSSIMLALMASGKDGERFTFHGYLPKERRERRAEILKLEKLAVRGGGAQIFIEAPYRNGAMLEDLLSICSPTTLLTLACEVTMEGGFVLTKSIEEWEESKVNINKRPTVFIL